ncbi:MAG TPA: hypothetical protein VEU07_08785 [Candidatus Acidoferrum sp.]|nr:hypothetical protein [Candidatus Acidoferrum sp.]
MRHCFALTVVMLAAAGCSASPPPTPQPAMVTVTLDLGGGGTGFAAVIYAQEVHSGKTTSHSYAAGSHGGVILPSKPITFPVDAPGTYVIYGFLVNAPESYHFGATGCKPAEHCPATGLQAVDVVPGGTYPVYIADFAAPIPRPHAPVTVPWHK